MSKKRSSGGDVHDLLKEIQPFVSRVPLWVWWVLVLLFGAFIFQLAFTSLSTIEYQGMTFTREKMGNIDFYHYAYYIDATTRYNLYVRTDPRKNTVPVQMPITFDETNDVLVSVNTTGLSSCEDSQLGIGQLSLFLVHNNLHVDSASPDPVFAQTHNVTLASCASSSNATVILFEEGTANAITRPLPGCYVLEIADCAVLPVVEKFITESLIAARNR